MSEQAIAIRNNGNLALSDRDPFPLAKRLENMIVNGKKLTPDERLALAQYSVTTGLNPFVGECYMLPGIGAGPGIAGWRKKADEQLEYEARKTNTPAARFWCEYMEPGEGEARYDASKGDIAVKAILHDTITRTDWEKRRMGYYIEMIKAGIKESAWELVSQLVGPEPVWSAVAVVRGGENFGGTEKMDRYERTCKRAEKAAIRKRFPRIDLPEPIGFDGEIVDVTAKDVANEPHTEAQIIGELYAESTPATNAQQAVVVDAIDITQEQPHGAPMTLVEAQTVTNSEGRPYGEIDSITLRIMANSMSKLIGTDKHKPEHDKKMLAIQTILEARNSTEQAAAA